MEVRLYRWMVYKRTSHLKMDDDWGYPCDLGNHHLEDGESLVKLSKMFMGIRQNHMEQHVLFPQKIVNMSWELLGMRLFF